ncbi:MAG: hypothetical protein WCN88_01975 [Candidatus Falkowbacteria bacterium]
MLDKNNAGFENKLLAKIKEGKMCPKPRWQFLLKDSVVWFAGLISLLIGAAAISVMIYLFKYNDWDIYDQTKKTFVEFFILTLPYYWFIFLGIFVFIISYNFKHTKTGYRYSGILLIGASILLSVILGAIFFAAGLGEKLDDILGRRAPFYDQVINRHIDFWSQPAEGRLSGLVIDKVDGTSLILIDRGKEQWLVSTENVELYSGDFIIVGQPIRVLGEIISEQKFRADKILPMKAGRDFYHRFDGPPPMRQKFMSPGIPMPLPPAI